MTEKRRRQGMAGSILEQFAELKSDYESVIGGRWSVIIDQ